MKDRIYICHTYYHVYVTFLKELKLRAEADPAKKAGAATLVLSKMSNNFEPEIPGGEHGTVRRGTGIR